MTPWETTVLHGRHVSVSPLDAAHADGLRAAAADGAVAASARQAGVGGKCREDDGVVAEPGEQGYEHLV